MIGCLPDCFSDITDCSVREDFLQYFGFFLNYPFCQQLSYNQTLGTAVMTIMISSQVPNPGDQTCPLDISSFGCLNSLMKLVTPKEARFSVLGVEKGN